MDVVVGAVFGLVQGLTEFLPVSSSGHLVVAQALLPGYSQPGIAFEIVLHAGTLLAIVYWYKKQICKIDTKYIKYLAIGSIPAAIVGLAFDGFVEGVFSNVNAVGAALLVTGVINLFVDKQTKKGKLGAVSSFKIGLAQAVAIIPGISRSGSTIFVARLLGLGKKQAARFSFLLSIPAILGANLLKVSELRLLAGQSPVFYVSGFLMAFVSGVAAINLVVRLLERKRFVFFGIYCLLLGFVVLLI